MKLLNRVSEPGAGNKDIQQTFIPGRTIIMLL